MRSKVSPRAVSPSGPFVRQEMATAFVSAIVVARVHSSPARHRVRVVDGEGDVVVHVHGGKHRQRTIVIRKKQESKSETGAQSRRAPGLVWSAFRFTFVLPFVLPPSLHLPCISASCICTYHWSTLLASDPA